MCPGGAAGNDTSLNDRLAIWRWVWSMRGRQRQLEREAGNLTSAAGDPGVADLAGNVVTNLAAGNRSVGAVRLIGSS